jgi:hypothetical protein
MEEPDILHIHNVLSLSAVKACGHICLEHKTFGMKVLPFYHKVTLIRGLAWQICHELCERELNCELWEAEGREMTEATTNSWK